MSDRDPVTPSAGIDATIEQAPQSAQHTEGLDATQLAPNMGPVSGMDATAIGPDEGLAATQMDSGDLARGSGTPNATQPATRGIESGTKIGRFLVTGELGAGGMGVVYAAYDPKLDRKVAIKMLHEGISQSHRARLEREARAMAKLTHPNVVSVHEVGEFENRLFVAMEFVDGKTLRDWLTHDKPDKKQIMKVMIDAGRGLAAAHAAEMAHRDFKPDNVLVGKDGRTRVSDFGLVTPVGSDTIDETPSAAVSSAPLTASALTQVGTIMGTPLYMAPEQHRGDSADHRADQFSFCVTLWEALYEHTPYSAKSYEALVDNVTSGRISPPLKANKGPAWIRSILTKGLSVAPSDRYESMNQLLRALESDPWLLRKRLALGGAFVAITGAAAAVLVFQGAGDNAAAVCQGANAHIENVWTAEKRSTITEAFGSSGVPGATEAWVDSEKRLDDYGKDWIKLRTQSCEATHLHKEQEMELFEFSMDCFDRRLLSYRSVLQLFTADPNEQVINATRKTVADLPDLHTCLSRSALEDGPRMPSDPIRKRQVLELMEEFEAVVRLGLRGEYKEALPLLEPIAKRAIELEYPPLEAQALILKGGNEQTLGDLDTAEQTFRQAASAAARANDDGLVALVWTRVLDLLVQKGEYDEALTIETVATTSAERVPESHDLQARLQNTLGGIYVAKARYEEAFTAYDKALSHIRATGNEENPALAPAIANLGLAHWYLGDIKSAKESFEAALAIMLRDLGPDHSQVAYARKNIADLAIQLGKNTEAYDHYQEVLRIWTMSLGPEHANLGYAYEQLARLALRSGDTKKALEYVEKTIKVREDALGPEHPINVQSLNVAIEIYVAIGTPESIAQAEDAIHRGLLLAGTLGEAGTTHKIYLFDARASLAESREQWNAALKDRSEVLALRRAAFGEMHSDTAYSFAMVAKLSMRLGDLDEADKLLIAAQAAYDSLPGFGDGDGVGMRRSRAMIRVEQGKPKAAMALLKEALEKARTGKDIGHMVAVVEFEIIKLRYDMGEKQESLTAAHTLLGSLDANQVKAYSADIQAWLKDK